MHYSTCFRIYYIRGMLLIISECDDYHHKVEVIKELCFTSEHTCNMLIFYDFICYLLQG